MAGQGKFDLKAQRYERIAVEEGFTIPEIAEEQRKRMPPAPPPSPFRAATFGALMDIGEGRIKAMDEDGIAKQVMVLAGAIVQDLDPVQGSELVALSNDRLAAAARAWPDRLTGLAALAPLDPTRAARELERGVRTLGLKGGIVNSHSRGEYLDDRKFWPIFEAAQGLDVPIYIHPRDPSPQMFQPFDMFGFKIGWSWAVEVGTHIVRLIWAGAFDAFPRLRIVIGHMGEGLPFCLDRVDNRYVWEHDMAGTRSKLKRNPSDYFRENVVITTSGMNFAPPLQLSLEMLGADNVLFAADYPFENVRESTAPIDAIALPDPVKQKLYHLNAKRVFKL
jgi:5-carboxyvanillate decarboxylase